MPGTRRDWFTLDARGQAVLPLRVQPRAARARIVGLADDGEGGRALKIAVTAPPEDGKANMAVIELLAEALGLAKNQFKIAVGASGRRKLVRVGRVDAAVLTRLRSWSTP